MPYVTRQFMERRFSSEEVSQLLDDDPSDSPTARFNAAAEDADGTINGYLGSVVTLPLACPVPELIVGIAADVTRYRLWDKKASAEVRRRYEDALTLLKDIAKGTIRLPVDAAPIATEYGGTILTTSRCRTFSDASLGSFADGGSLVWPPRTD